MTIVADIYTGFWDSLILSHSVFISALWWVIKGPVVGSIMVSVFGAKGGGQSRQRV